MDTYRLKVHGQHSVEVELRSALFTPGGEDWVGQANLVTAPAGMPGLQPALVEGAAEPQMPSQLPKPTATTVEGGL